jgi:ABC-type branched-subunit amino acid transport system substrate-binding protein
MSVRIISQHPLVQAAIALVVLSLGPVAVGASSGVARAMRDTLRVGLLLPDDGGDRARMESIRRGVELGVEEASRTAALFGLVVKVEAERGRADDGALRAARRLADRRVSAMITAVDGATCRALVALAAERRIVLLDLDCAADTADRNACDRFAFHVRPTAITMQRARARLPDVAVGSATDMATPALWHHTLQRFGAEQLNDRFRRRFGTEMGSAAWGGWVAMKILTEAALRGGSASSVNLARYLSRRAARFDGHKGEPLAFDPATGELRQPLYLIARTTPSDTTTRVIAEVPEGAVFGPPGTSQHGDVCEGTHPTRRTL